MKLSNLEPRCKMGVSDQRHAPASLTRQEGRYPFEEDGGVPVSQGSVCLLSG